jgi:hypothetical protein
LNPNSSEDTEIKIKGLLDIQVGDYYQDDLPSQQEEAEEVLALAKAATMLRKQEEKQLKEQEEQGIEDVIAAHSSDPDKEDKEAPVTNYLRP